MAQRSIAGTAGATMTIAIFAAAAAVAPEFFLATSAFAMPLAVSPAKVPSLPAANAPASNLIDELDVIESDLETVRDAVSSLARVTLGDWQENFALRRDPERAKREGNRAVFHSRTREVGAADATLSGGRAPLFDDEERTRRSVVALQVARASGNHRRIFSACMGFLGEKSDVPVDALAACSVEISRGTEPELPLSTRIGAREFASFARHPRVARSPDALLLSLALASGFMQLGEPDAALACVREARLRAPAGDAWRGRAAFVEAALLYQMGETDKGVDIWRALSGESLATLQGVDVAPEHIDAHTRVLALRDLARAYTVRGQLQPAREAYERLLALPEAFRSPGLEASLRQQNKVFFPARGVLPLSPDAHPTLDRSAVLADLARVLWRSGDDAAAARMWQASGLVATPSVLASLSRDAANRDTVSLATTSRLGEARADAAFLRAAAKSALNESPPAGPSAGVDKFEVVRARALSLSFLAKVYNEGDEGPQARKVLARWQPLLSSQVEGSDALGEMSEAVLSPVQFLENGALEKKEWMAFHVLAKRWDDLWRIVRRADAISALAWSDAPLPHAHRDELWRRLGALDDSVSRTIEGIRRRSSRDNHRENLGRVVRLTRTVDALHARLAAVRYLGDAEAKRKLRRGTVGIVATVARDGAMFALERDIVAAERALREASLEERLLLLSDDSVFPPVSEAARVFSGSAATLDDLVVLQRRSLATGLRLASPGVAARLDAMWAEIAAASNAFRKASSDMRAAALASRRDLAGEAQALLVQRNGYENALAVARRSSTADLQRDVDDATALLLRATERREDELRGVIATLHESRVGDARAEGERVARAQKEREAFLRALKASLEMGTAR